MPPGQLRIVVGQQAGRDQMPADELGVLLAQTAQIATDVGVETVSIGPVLQVRPLLADLGLPDPRSPVMLGTERITLGVEPVPG